MDEQSNKTTELFFDDFTSSKLNRSQWNVEVRGQVYNNEQQAYVDSPETIYLEKGDESANGIRSPYYQYFTKSEPAPKRSPKTGVRAAPAPLFSGFYKLFRDLLIMDCQKVRSKPSRRTRSN